jgi:hypothetical protein
MTTQSFYFTIPFGVVKMMKSLGKVQETRKKSKTQNELSTETVSTTNYYLKLSAAVPITVAVGDVVNASIRLSLSTSVSRSLGTLVAIVERASQLGASVL